MGISLPDHAAGINGNMGRASKIGIHYGPDPATFPQGVVSGQEQSPASIAVAEHGLLCPVPAVEITGQIQLIGIGSPLSVNPAAIHRMDAKIIMSIGKIPQHTAIGHQARLGVPVKLHPIFNIPGKGLQLGIQFQ